MGYYATWSGVLKMKEAPTKMTMNELNSVFDDAYYDSKKNQLELYGHEKYHEDDVYSVLNEIKSIVKSGEIEFTGEDESHWRIMLVNDEWIEESGAVYYESEMQPAKDNKDDIVNCIMDLVQNCVDIPQDKTLSGKWYQDVKKRLISILEAWKVF